MSSRSRQHASLRRELVGVAEVANRLGLTAERVRQLSKIGAMPEPLGELGRRVVWDWRDVQAWARSEGRLDAPDGETRQVAQPWRRRPRGSLRLVVDELLQWGTRDSDVCHVRIWAPTAGNPQPQIVLLGQLEDRTNSVTNNVEQVAMAAAARFLGPDWRAAQYYQYGPAGLLDDADVFLHVTFSIRPVKSGWRRAAATGPQTTARALGGEFADPDWRKTSIEEIEHLTGDSPRIWAPGTYTRALVELARSQSGTLELIWDPARAAELSEIVADLEEGDASTLCGYPVNLRGTQRSATAMLLRQIARSAYETALQDVTTQRAGAAIGLRPPELHPAARLWSADADSNASEPDPYHLWAALTVLREALIHGEFGDDAELDRLRRLLVPGLRGGWVPLHWADAGVEERHSEREGWGGPVALPQDLVGDGSPAYNPGAAERAVLLLHTLETYLAETWSDWSWHNVPRFMPSTELSTSGPLTRRYLDQLVPPAAEASPEQLARLVDRSAAPEWVGVDPDGWLVVLTKGRSGLTCEWPVSGPADPGLSDCRIQADRPDGHGGTPVYLINPQGRITLLPSAAHRRHGNAFAWGYGGGGPWDLTAAVLDLLQRADPDGDLDIAVAEKVVRDRVASPRTPDWLVSELLEEIRRHVLRPSERRGRDDHRDA